MTEYTVLIIGDADRWWTSLTTQERSEGYAQYARFNQALADGGHSLVGGAELTRTSEARSIPKGGGAVTAGPYAETVEAVGGYRTDITEEQIKGAPPFFGDDVWHDRNREQQMRDYWRDVSKLPV